jgi:hypothetical protein
MDEDIFLKVSTETNSLHYVNIFEEYVELIINNETHIWRFPPEIPPIMCEQSFFIPYRYEAVVTITNHTKHRFIFLSNNDPFILTTSIIKLKPKRLQFNLPNKNIAIIEFVKNTQKWDDSIQDTKKISTI